MATARETTARPMTQRVLPARRFRVLDAMILVAATAVGCALVNGISAISNGESSWQNIYKEVTDLLQGQAPAGWLFTAMGIAAEFTVFLVSPIVAMWGVALIPIRLTGPRPRWRRLARQPGLTAACAATLAASLIGSYFLSKLLVPSNQYLGVGWTLVIAQDLIGMAVLAAWMTLILGGRWRAEPSWIDRLGRLIGAFWILLGLAVMVLTVVE